jgi:ABC-2 type transport system permease protein
LTAAFALAKSFLLSSLREWDELFWFWLFPIVLLAFLGVAFGGVERGEMELRVILANGDRGPIGQSVLEGLGIMTKEANFSLRVEVLEATENVDELFFWAKRKVEEGEAHAALFIPASFSAELWEKGYSTVQILYRRGESGSSTAASALLEFLEEFGHTLLERRGILATRIPVEMRMVGGEARPVSYVEFVLPGIILMAFFVYGLFGVPDAVRRAKEVGIIKRYFATPLSGEHYLLGFSLSALFVNLMQVLLIWAFARFALGARLSLLRPATLGFLFLGVATSLSLGFLISAISRTSQGATAFATLLNLPAQFLGGLYFPVTSMPKALQWLLIANPLTHLAEGLRASLGLSTLVYPLWLSLLVPLLWISGSLILAALRIRLGEAG